MNFTELLFTVFIEQMARRWSFTTCAQKEDSISVSIPICNEYLLIYFSFSSFFRGNLVRFLINHLPLELFQR